MAQNDCRPNNTAAINFKEIRNDWKIYWQLIVRSKIVGKHLPFKMAWSFDRKGFSILSRSIPPDNVRQSCVSGTRARVHTFEHWISTWLGTDNVITLFACLSCHSDTEGGRTRGSNQGLASLWFRSSICHWWGFFEFWSGQGQTPRDEQTSNRIDLHTEVSMDE